FLWHQLEAAAAPHFVAEWRPAQHLSLDGLLPHRRAHAVAEVRGAVARRPCIEKVRCSVTIAGDCGDAPAETFDLEIATRRVFEVRAEGVDRGDHDDSGVEVAGAQERNELAESR